MMRGPVSIRARDAMARVTSASDLNSPHAVDHTAEHGYERNYFSFLPNSNPNLRRDVLRWTVSTDAR